MIERCFLYYNYYYYYYFLTRSMGCFSIATITIMLGAQPATTSTNTKGKNHLPFPLFILLCATVVPGTRILVLEYVRIHACARTCLPSRGSDASPLVGAYVGYNVQYL